MDKPWRVYGCLIRFNEVDFVGDLFLPDTDYGSLRHEIPVYWEHGIRDDDLNKSIGDGQLERRDDGIWIDAVLTNLPTGYARALRRMTRDSLVGWSSGSAGHLTRRRPGDDGIKIVEKWIPVEASLTVSPMAPLPATRTMMKHVSYDQLALELMAQVELHRAEMLIAEAERTGNLRRGR